MQKHIESGLFGISVTHANNLQSYVRLETWTSTGRSCLLALD